MLFRSKALWKAKIDAIVVSDASKIKELRQLIDSTCFPYPRKRIKGEALVPSLTPMAEEEEEGEEKEE